MVGGSLAVGAGLGAASLRGQERDSAIGAVLAFGLGVGVLLLSLYQGYATEATNLLFGSIVGVDGHQLRVLSVVALLVLAALAVSYRPLLFSSVDPDAAEARGVPPAVPQHHRVHPARSDVRRGDPGRRGAPRPDARHHARRRRRAAPDRATGGRNRAFDRHRGRLDRRRNPPLARTRLADQLLHQLDLLRLLRVREGAPCSQALTPGTTQPSTYGADALSSSSA